MPRRQADASAVNPLASLIRNRMTDQRWSTYDVERQGGPPARTVGHLADPHTALSVLPRPDTIRALAKGLNLPLALIARTACDSYLIQMGVGPVATADESVYLTRVREVIAPLPEHRQAQVAEFVQRMVDTWAEPARAGALRGRARRRTSD